MKARFISDDPTEGDTVYGGVDFPLNEWVTVSADLAKKLAPSPCFEVDTDEDGEDGPTVEELRAECDKRGIPYRPNAGVKRLKELLGD